MRLCRLDDEGWEPIKLPWEYVIDLYHNAMSRIFSFLDRDTKHAIICKIIHRHKKPEKKIKVKSPEDVIAYAKYIPETSPWFCLRCGEKCEVNLMIDIDYTPWSDWKQYCKMVDIPRLVDEFTSIPRKDETEL